MKGDKTTSQKQAGRSKPAGARERCSARHDDGALRSTSSVSSNRIPGVATKVGVPGGETSFPTTTLSLGGGARGRSADTTGDDALPSVTSSASRARDPSGAATSRVPDDRAKRASSRPSSASASCRAETHRKSALCSTSDIASMSSAETSSDDKSAIPTGRLAELAAVGDGTTSEASASDAACRTNCPKRAARRPSRYDDNWSPFFKQRKCKGRASSAPQKDPVASGDDLKMQWCRDCGKRLIPSEVVMFKGDTESAVEEVLAIIDTRITSSLCAKDDVAQQPLFKITNFTVYDEHGHVCAFDGGLIEADVTLYLSGHIKSICADDPGLQDSVAVARAGPVVSWWTTGYDGGVNVVLGLGTAYAEYVLMKPSDQYEPYMKRMGEKMYLLRGVLEKLIESSGDASFDEVVHHLETLEGLPIDVGPLTLETLHQYSQFVVDQVQAYDLADDADDGTLLLDSAFICDLIRITGAVIRNVPKWRSLPTVEHREAKKPKSPFVMPAVCKTLEELCKAASSTPKRLVPARKNRCGLCEACLASECKVCVFCLNMKKYGGPGTFKQCCVRRRCQQRHLLDSVDCTGTDSMDQEVSTLPDEPFAQREFVKRYGIDVVWTGDSLGTSEGKTFYQCCSIGSDVNVTVGEGVIVLSTLLDIKCYIGRVTQLYADKEGKKFAHVIWFRRYEETIFGSYFFGVSGELFSTMECDEVPLEAIRDVCSIVFHGKDGAHVDVARLKGSTFFYRFQCHVKTCTFTEANAECPSCLCAQQQKCAKTLAYLPNINSDCFFVKPSAIRVPLRPKLSETTHEDSVVPVLSGNKFTESYRKILRPPHIEDCNSPDPYRICCIVSKGPKGKTRRRNGDSTLLVQPFYRDYEVTEGSKDKLHLCLSPKSFSIELTDVVAPCEVVYRVGGSLGTCFDTVRPPFYFSQCYDAEENTYSEPTAEAKQIDLHLVSCSPPPDTLKAIDVYCGCGGLSLGLLQSGVAETVLALSDNEHHLNTFRMNFPFVCAPRSCPSNVLRGLQSGKASLELSVFKKGEIHLVCGTPSFESSKCSDGLPLSNSQLATFLGFCEFYDPQYVVLVAERRAVKYSNGSGLVIALKCLLDLGYQTSCSILQDGCYGIPQSHRRLVIFGAKRGLAKLPAFPPVTHAFDIPERHLTFSFDGRAYTSPLAATSAAPYPRTTLRDAIGDLARDGGAGPVTDFMRFCGRRGAPRDADCFKRMNPMAQARIELVPRTRGSDWRDLPNVEVQLSDGTTAKRLVYTHKCASSPYRHQRGVCACAEDSTTPCDPRYRQENTLIPWSLVHTAHRSGQWSGVYGRLQWDGYLHSVVANPEPLSKQGPVIHPEEDRVISVRECARIQGYPDDFVFLGPTLERYKMIAMSVAPLLAIAIGRELAKTLH
ncbi:DNA (cytosine-5)-methyltransferase PliMCI-like [Rhipicephalus microplus]|uniref:DNA (cytosine-5)-methyltransferase PliMCI-like n=1 Tax=Rhipicephalus microplus TaxID=6941 RepID=UPI003F6C1D54